MSEAEGKGPEIKGWCPGAHRPMMSGDGLVVRVRPRVAELSVAQVLALCEAATRFGAGLIDLTNRANLQIRGVAEAHFAPLIETLEAAGLLDATEAQESRRNIVTEPFWVPGSDTERLSRALIARLDELPALPPKMGFAIDAGARPCLGDTPADFRIERAGDRRLILRADGRDKGMPLVPGAEIDALIALAHWFAGSGGAQAGRMRRHGAPLPDWATGTLAPATPLPAPRPGAHGAGAVLGAVFGQMRADDLAALMRATGALSLRVTPWRCVILPGVRVASVTGFTTDPEDPALRVDACAGAPFCPQAQVATRDLALALAPRVAGSLHVSGCAKGCAHPGAADVAIWGEGGAYALAFGAASGDTPLARGLSAEDLLTRFGARPDAP